MTDGQRMGVLSFALTACTCALAANRFPRRNTRRIHAASRLAVVRFTERFQPDREAEGRKRRRAEAQKKKSGTTACSAAASGLSPPLG